VARQGQQTQDERMNLSIDAFNNGIDLSLQSKYTI
jgi:hypothetical protein